jgi:hypothetical protein
MPTENFVGAQSVATMYPRSTFVGDRSISMLPIKLPAAVANILTRGRILFAATKDTTMALATDAALPGENDVVGILTQDVSPDTAVVVDTLFFMAISGEVNKGLVRDKAGLTAPNLLLLEEILYRRGIILKEGAYGDNYVA